MAVSGSIITALSPFLPVEQIEDLATEIENVIESDSQFQSPPAGTAELVMKMCLEQLIEGWQLQQKSIYRYSRELGIECDVRISTIAPDLKQLLAVCHGPANKLQEMKNKVIEGTRGVVLDAEKSNGQLQQ